jgi:hypothetical protein
LFYVESVMLTIKTASCGKERGFGAEVDEEVDV